MTMKRLLIAAWILCAVAVGPARAQESVDLLLHNGKIFAADELLSTAYTRLAAYLTFEEDIKGSLEVGKLADMVVLSEDLLTIDPDRTMDTQVEMTILGGTIVYQRE